jgi:hypothetical protein
MAKKPSLTPTQLGKLRRRVRTAARRELPATHAAAARELLTARPRSSGAAFQLGTQLANA